MVKIMKKIGTISLFILVFLHFMSYADIPITTDNRIKTYIYSPNEVFKLVVFNGYQSSIELSKSEEVRTISIGDSFAWRISPVGNRIFVRSLEDNVHTNLTILTNKRAYQFDLFSKKIGRNIDKELVYVLRFFYPEELEKQK